MVEELGGNVVSVLRSGERLTARALAAAVKKIVALKPDLIHGHLFGAGELAAYRAARTLGIPFVVTVHGFDAHRGFRRWVRGRVRRRAARVVAVSEALREYVMKTDRVHPERIMTIPNGIDTKRFRPKTPTIPPPVANGEDEGGGSFTIVAVGRLVPEKAYDVLVRAVAKLRGFNWQLQICGDGQERTRLKKLGKELRVSRQIKFLGAINNIPGVLRAADVFVHPSRTEGHGRAILEAMASGLPVIATSVGGTPEAITDGETGLLVPPDDPGMLAAAIRRIQADRELAQRLGARARAAVEEKFSVERMRASYKKLYADIASS